MHCSGTDRTDDIESIRYWHKWIGWKDIGYHFFIDKSGSIHLGRPINFVGAHAKGYNSFTIGICLSGSSDFKEAQFIAATFLIDTLATMLENKSTPWILPHNSLNKHKTCPNFDLSRIAKYSCQNKDAFLSHIV
jgi:hypothetical protein